MGRFLQLADDVPPLTVAWSGLGCDWFLSSDADTTGAVCGQLAGAYWGESGIPAQWLEGLSRRDMIEGAIEGLLGGGA
jgi:hypothetical protein